MRSPNLDSLQRKSFVKKINERCRKSLFCEHCCFMNGPVKKAGALKITHDRFAFTCLSLVFRTNEIVLQPKARDGGAQVWQEGR